MKIPSTAEAVKNVIQNRLDALKQDQGIAESVTIEWRGKPQAIPVISMPIDLLHYNPDTHRIKAQTSVNPTLEKELVTDPYGASAQGFLHQLLMGDPADPTKIDSDFTALKDDILNHGQSDPGIITRAGVLINGNTRRAALRELGEQYIRVGVLPSDASHDDLLSIELSLQLRKDHKRDYSFMNSLLALEERAFSGQPASRIQSDFRIKSTTFDQRIWILAFVKEAIQRSEITSPDGQKSSLRLIDFETHQGKLEELYRAYTSLKPRAPDKAEALREQRLLALALEKSKTDLRLIDPDFTERYMKHVLPPETDLVENSSRKIPGTSITVAGPGKEVEALKQLTTQVLQAKAIAANPSGVSVDATIGANAFIKKVDESIGKALDLAGKQARIVKKRFAPVDRISDACDDLGLAVSSIAEARSTGNFDAAELDEVLLTLRSNLEKLSAIIARGYEGDSESIAWILLLGQVGRTQG
jgi:hypothetical protein